MDYEDNFAMQDDDEELDGKDLDIDEEEDEEEDY
jgi:hypothetical protein